MFNQKGHRLIGQNTRILLGCHKFDSFNLRVSVFLFVFVRIISSPNGSCNWIGLLSVLVFLMGLFVLLVELLYLVIS